MEALVLRKEIEPLPIQKEASFVSDYEGFLNSNYKQVVKKNFFHSNPKSIFGIKQRVKSRQYQHNSAVGALLKLSVFVITLMFVL